MRTSWLGLLGVLGVTAGCRATTGHDVDRGSLITTQQDARPLVRGPATVHVNALTAGGAVFLANDTSVQGYECPSPVLHQIHKLRTDRTTKLWVPADQIACLMPPGNGFEVHWHTYAPVPTQTAFAAKRLPPK